MFEKLMFIIAFMIFAAVFLTGVALLCSPFVEKGLLTRGQMVGVVMAATACFGWYTMVASEIVSVKTPSAETRE